MTDNLTIRAALAEDVPLVLEFVKALAEYEKLSDRVTATTATLHDSLFGAHPGAEVMLAFAGEAPVGFAVFCHNFSTFLGVKGLWLEDIFVKPQFRGRGYGKALLLHAARIAHDRGCGRFEWAVLDWNTPAWAFYKSLGAVPLDDWTMFRVTGDALKQLAMKSG